MAQPGPTPSEGRHAVDKERGEVPEPPPVSCNGRRYEAVLWGRARGLPQNGGYVAVIDEASGREIRLVKIYDAPFAQGKEGDKADLFIKSLSLEAGGRQLRILHERGAEFLLNLETLAVSRARP